MNKTIKFALLLSAITCISCKKTELTPTKWLNELSDKKVQSSVKVSDYVNSKSVWYNSNLESLNKDGFEVTAFNAVNNKMWQEHFIKSGENFGSDKAMWTKAGKMNFYAAHPSTFSFDENQVLQQNTGTNSPLNYDWQIWGTKAFSIYAGQTSHIEHQAVTQTTDAILRFMKKTKIIKYRIQNAGYESVVFDESELINVIGRAIGKIVRRPQRIVF